MEDLKKSFLVIKPSIARKLLKMGFNIIDIRPQKQENKILNRNKDLSNYDRSSII